MISDEPDEDADLLDDDALIEAITGPVGQTAIPGHASAPADWPLMARQAATLTIDSETLAWFQARDMDWQPHARAVLRAWIAARKSPGT